VLGRRRGPQRVQAFAATGETRLPRNIRRDENLGPVADALGGRPCGEAPTRELFTPGPAFGKRVFRGLPAARHGLDRPFDPLPPAAELGNLTLVRGQIVSALPDLVADELPARLECLALQSGVELGRLSLSLERAQAGTRLPLHVERTIEVVLSAL